MNNINTDILNDYSGFYVGVGYNTDSKPVKSWVFNTEYDFYAALNQGYTISDGSLIWIKTDNAYYKAINGTLERLLQTDTVFVDSLKLIQEELDAITSSPASLLINNFYSTGIGEQEIYKIYKDWDTNHTAGTEENELQGPNWEYIIGTAKTGTMAVNRGIFYNSNEYSCIKLNTPMGAGKYALDLMIFNSAELGEEGIDLNLDVWLTSKDIKNEKEKEKIINEIITFQKPDYSVTRKTNKSKDYFGLGYTEGDIFGVWKDSRWLRITAGNYIVNEHKNNSEQYIIIKNKNPETSGLKNKVILTGIIITPDPNLLLTDNSVLDDMIIYDGGDATGQNFLIYNGNEKKEVMDQNVNN